ncbi:MAG: WYL domain-containing protein [Planctomycetes bacterium]|nr:WYL domain-containing protein [Planctomycetota bacterium]
MRRADRLFQLVQLLRRGRVTTAARIADEMEVSERTVYRDVADLVANGVPVEGEAGVGYVLPASFDLPPLLFDPQEIEALVVGARLVTTWTDSELARAAKSALVKVEHVLPDRLKAKLGRTRLFAPEFARAGDHAALPAVRAALEEERVLRFDYTDEQGRASERRARPLGLFFWGKVWTLAAWCETRRDFRTFRVDRMREARATDERFPSEPGRTLEDYLALVAREECAAGERARAADTRAAGGTPRAASGATPRAARTKPPKLDLDADERAALRAAGVATSELADLGGAEIARRVGGALPRARCVELAALAAFQRLGSVGLETARDFVVLGLARVEDLAGRDPVALYRELERRTRTKHDPCVEDVFRCAIAQAEEPGLAPKLREWWH